MNDVPDLAGWTAVSGGFTGQDQAFYCSTSGQVARPGEPIYRGQLIDMEGFYSVCRDSALQLGKLAGLVDPDVADLAVARQIVLEDALAEAREIIRVQANYIDAEYALDQLEDELVIEPTIVNDLQEFPPSLHDHMNEDGTEQTPQVSLDDSEE